MKLTITILVCFVAVNLMAQWSNNPAVNNPICTATLDQVAPVSVTDGNNGAIIVWQDQRNNNDYRLYAQRIDLNGYTLWTSNGIPVCPNGVSQIRPRMISDGTGGAIIVFEDERSPFDVNLYVQHIDGNGNLLWTDDAKPVCLAPNQQSYSDIINDGVGGAIITWQDFRTGIKVYAQRIDGTGTPLWTTNGVAVATNTRFQEYPKLTTDGNGGAIIAWRDRTSPGIQNAITAQWLNNAGVRQWASTGNTVCTNTSDPVVMPEIISNGFGGAFVVWQDYRSLNYDIYAQNMSSSGLNTWIMDGIAVCNAADNQINPRVVSNGSNGIIVAWNDRRAGSFSSPYVQQVNAAGIPQWTANGIAASTLAAGDNFIPAVASDNAGGIVLAWQDMRGADADIYAQHLDASGNPVWIANGAVVTSAPNFQGAPTLIFNANNTAIAAWLSFNADADIYTSRILNNGTLPLSLIAFTASKQQNGNLINWTVSADPGLDHFDIERSDDGVHFNSIGRVNSRTNQTIADYSFTDQTALPVTQYYRLKLTGTNNSSRYSQIVRIVTGSVRVLKTYPNPANSTLSIECPAGNTGAFTIKVFDQQGQFVKQVQTPSANVIQFDCSGLSNGYYLLQLTAGANQYSTPIIINH